MSDAQPSAEDGFWDWLGSFNPEARYDEKKIMLIAWKAARSDEYETVRVRELNQALAALRAEREALAAAMRDYFHEEKYLAETEMHDNHTDRARSRDRQAKALDAARRALKESR